jgi:hypothetical protein
VTARERKRKEGSWERDARSKRVCKFESSDRAVVTAEMDSAPILTPEMKENANHKSQINSETAHTK